MTRRDLLLAAVGSALRKRNIESAFAVLDSAAHTGEAAASVIFLHHKDAVTTKAFGTAPGPEAVFLLASITKPMTATAVMVLADKRELRLEDSVQRFIPEFQGNGKDQVLIRHLLTHTSGLPDMLPSNEDLRKRHAPLSDFVAGTCKTPLLFEPGTQVRYQSMGILLASEIVARITKQPFPAFLEENVFRPLRMADTSLGLGKRSLSDTMRCQVDQPSDWDWNSPYWRNLGSPWGGAHAPAKDIALLLRYFADPQDRLLKPATARMMVTNQTRALKQSWGIGWKLDSSSRFGHSGSTGTLCWHDSAQDLTFVLLTTRPAEHSAKTVLEPVSKLISTAA